MFGVVSPTTALGSYGLNVPALFAELTRVGTVSTCPAFRSAFPDRPFALQLAEQLGVAQQTLAHYEGARLRVPASMLPQLAQILGVPVDVLIGPPVKAEPARRGRS